MMLITPLEILYLIILTLAVGYIFSGFIRLPKRGDYYAYHKPKFFDWRDIKFAAIVAAPAIIFHEFAHKFVALGFGLSASFSIFWFGLFLGVVLRLINSPFLILAPAFVSIPALTSPAQGAWIAAAGPLMNLCLFFASSYLLKHKNLKKKEFIGLVISKKLNLLLFIFNMIPFPPLDGYRVLEGILQLF
ncbi:hypothetical protein HZB88_02535 [archaeon]|nr:hypothetical protein [archaeon]